MSERAVTPVVERTTVVANERLAAGVGLITLRAPRIARTVRPGQFVHLRISVDSTRILRRPFSVHRAHQEAIEILYQVLGAGTRELSMKEPGDRTMDAVGPLGHGWEVPDGVAHALIVAGGLGAAPMGMLVEELARRGVAVVVALGAPTAARLVARETIGAHARRLELATDDGTAGFCGLVTEVSEALLATERFDVVYACGPEAMQRRVAEQARSHGAPCFVSLERSMACGIGVCLSCVVDTVDGLKRACVEGPVFSAEEVLWR